MRPYHLEEDEKKKVLTNQLAPWLVPGHPPRNYAASSAPDTPREACWDGTAGLVIFKNKLVEGNVISPCTTITWMGKELCVPWHTVDPCYAIAAAPESCGLLGPLISHNCRGIGNLPLLTMMVVSPWSCGFQLREGSGANATGWEGRSGRSNATGESMMPMVLLPRVMAPVISSGRERAADGGGGDIERAKFLVPGSTYFLQQVLAKC